MTDSSAPATQEERKAEAKEQILATALSGGRPRRGRPPGSKNRPKEGGETTRKPLKADSITAALKPAHEGLFSLSAAFMRREVPQENIKAMSEGVSEMAGQSLSALSGDDGVDPKFIGWIYLSVLGLSLASLLIYPKVQRQQAPQGSKPEPERSKPLPFPERKTQSFVDQILEEQKGREDAANRSD